MWPSAQVGQVLGGGEAAVHHRDDPAQTPAPDVVSHLGPRMRIPAMKCPPPRRRVWCWPGNSNDAAILWPCRTSMEGNYPLPRAISSVAVNDGLRDTHGT